ncbi:MAG: hypothetical protein U1F43_28010 [Myxococcota bacterium]
MRFYPISLAVLGVALGACAEDGRSAGGPALALDIAALTLDGVADAVWDIHVENEAGQTVFETRITSSRYGDGRGSATYIGTCDADANGDPSGVDYDPAGDPSAHWNKVFVSVSGLYAAGVALDADHDEYGENDGDFAPDAGGPYASIAFQDPGTLSRLADCRENADTQVEFDVALMRPAHQGFFDIAVSFNDIFCSAKLDCDAGDLLFDASGARRTTDVLGLACAVGGEHAPRLLMDDVVIACGDVVTTVDPTAPDGNLCASAGRADGSAGPSGCVGLSESSPGAGPLYQAAVYRSTDTVDGEHLAYWNVALGVETPAFDLASCSLRTKATADDLSAPVLVGTPPTAVAAGSVYPYIAFDLSSDVADADPTTTGDAKSLAACGANPLTLGGAPHRENVEVAYTGTSGAGASFAHAFPAFPAAPAEDPFAGTPVLTLEKSVLADISQVPSGNIWGATFLGGTLYAQSLGDPTTVARYDRASDALVPVLVTPDSNGMGNDGEHIVVGSEQGCAGGPTCVRRYTLGGALVDEQPMSPVTGGLRGVTSRGSKVFMLGVIGACPDSIGPAAIDFGAVPAVAGPDSCAGVADDTAIVATATTIITGRVPESGGGGVLSVYDIGSEVPRTLTLPGYTGREITAMAWDAASQTLVVIGRSRFAFYHVAAP